MTRLDALSPDQRAVIQLVLQQERSYEDLAALLGIPVDSVRARAVAGLEAVAGSGDLTADHRAFVTDFLLGQLTVSERESARRFLSTTPHAREWALDVSYELADLGGDLLPEVPEGEDDSVPAATAPVEPAQDDDDFDDGFEDDFDDNTRGSQAGVSTFERDQEAGAAPPSPRPRPRPRPEVSRAGADARPRSSRLGGALLIAGISLVVAVLLFKFLKDDTDTDKASTATPTPTQTATAAQPQQLFAVPLTGVGGSGAKGTMAVYQQDQQVFFALEAQDVPKEKQGEAYAIWLIGGGKSRRLGYFQDPVEKGRLGTIGPESKDIPNFPKWLTTYERIVISRETRKNATQPGPIILQGRLPAPGA